MSNANYDCDVLVVGAGPTGLIAANLLQRSGVHVRIVEKRTAPTPESRAFAVQARTLELMQSIGLSDEFISRGVMATGIDIHVRGKRRGGLNLDRADAADTPFQYILMIPQSESEAILIDDLAELGVNVERGLDVIDVSQDANEVVTTIEAAADKRQQIRSRYVIGADGSRSVVRSAANIKFTGGTYAQSFLLADCKVDWELDHQRFRVFINGRRIGLFLPLDGTNLSRVMTTDLTDEDAASASSLALKSLDLNVEDMQGAFEEAAGIPAKLSNPIWVTRYRAHHRASEHYRAGRIFVAGDAAHIHSPAGGQGMNTGLQDAANLAWKIACVINRDADDELLDNYHDERKPVGELVVKSTGKLFSASAGQSGWRATLRDYAAMTMLPLISRAPPFHRKAFLGTSQRNISYGLSRFVCEGPKWPSKGPRAGERAPNVRINDDLDMFKLLQGYRFNIIAFSRRPLDTKMCQQVRESLDILAARFDPIGTSLICRADRGRNTNSIFASRPDVFDQYGLDQGADDQAIFVVRPDNYVAWRVSGLNFQSCERFLAEFDLRTPGQIGETVAAE